MSDNLEVKIKYILATLSKLNVTLSKTDEEIIKWLKENKTDLDKILTVRSILADEGITIDDLMEQIKFGKEFRALLMFQQEYGIRQSNGPVCTTVGTYIYSRNMFKNHSANQLSLPDNVSSYDIRAFSTGCLQIQLLPERITATGTDLLFSTTNGQNKLNIVQTTEGPVITIEIASTKITINSQDFKFEDLEIVDSIMQKRLFILPIVKENNTYYISNLIGIGNIEDNEITLSYDNPQPVSFDDISAFVENLPEGVQFVTNIFSQTIDDNYKPFKQLYITSILEEIVPQATQSYSALYTNDLSYGLYGQGAAVSISQLYNLAASTLRRVEVNYSLEGDSPVDAIPKYFEPINLFSDVNVPLNLNLNAGYSVSDGAGNVSNYDMSQYPVFAQLGSVINNRVVYDQELGDHRLSIPKVSIARYASGSQTDQQAWFETRLSNITNVKLTNNIVTVKGIRSKKVYSQYSFSAIAGGIHQPALYGFLLNVLASSEDADVGFDYIQTTTYTCNATTDLYFMLKPNNLSSESTNTMTYNIKYDIDGVTKNHTAEMRPKRILYGQASINAYESLLSTTSASTTYTIESKVPFSRSTQTKQWYVGNRMEQIEYGNAPYAFDSTAPMTLTIWAPRTTGGANVYDKPLGFVSTINTPNSVNAGGQLLFTPPWAPTVWKSGMSESFTSCYLSLGTAFQSNSTSPLKIQTSIFTRSVIRNAYTSKDMSTFERMSDGTYNLIIRAWPSETIEKVFTPWSPVTGFSTALINHFSNIQLLSFSGTVTEIELPEGIYNQFALSESITNLQASVTFLAMYADYLKYLIDNTNDRITIVEQTVQDIITTINDIIEAITPKQPSLGGQILSFLGSSVGMFFPLTGLAINIMGQLYNGVLEVKDGNILTGSIDLATGAIMSVLGVRKFKQRMDRKYGATPVVQVTPPDRLPTYDELYGPPGYTSVGTNSLRTVGTLQLSSGAIKNTSLEYLSPKTELKTYMVQEGLLRSWNNTLIEMAHNAYRTSSTNPIIMGRCIELWENDSFVSMLYDLVILTHDDQNNVYTTIVSDNEFIANHGSKITKNQFVKILYSYLLLGDQISSGLGFDQEVFEALQFSNASLDRSGYSKNFKTSRLKTCQILPRINIKENLNTHKVAINTNQDLRVSKIPLSTFSNALNPFINDRITQMQIFDNLHDYYVS